MVLCGFCNTWNKWAGTTPFFFDKVKRMCSNCSKETWDWHSLISLRTWDIKRGKRRVRK